MPMVNPAQITPTKVSFTPPWKAKRVIIITDPKKPMLSIAANFKDFI